jgi:hypothetical protein
MPFSRYFRVSERRSACPLRSSRIRTLRRGYSSGDLLLNVLEATLSRLVGTPISPRRHS